MELEISKAKSLNIIEEFIAKDKKEIISAFIQPNSKLFYDDIHEQDKV